jgi:hypothetical protein
MGRKETMMQDIRYYLLVILVWLKGLLNVQSDSDLLWLLINKLITPEMQALLIELIREASRMNISSAEKKRYVMNRLDILQNQLQTNIYTLKEETISMAVNMLVEYLQLHGELKRKSEEVKNEIPT